MRERSVETSALKGANHARISLQSRVVVYWSVHFSATLCGIDEKAQTMTIRILEAVYSRPIVGDVPLVSCQYLQECRKTPGKWRRYTVVAPIVDGALVYDTLLNVPLAVLEVLAAVLPADQWWYYGDGI